MSLGDETNGPTGYYPHAYESLVLNPLQELVSRVIGNVGNDPSPRCASTTRSPITSRCAPGLPGPLRELPELRFNSHFGWDILPDSGAEQQLSANEPG